LVCSLLKDMKYSKKGLRLYAYINRHWDSISTSKGEG
jgi:hypothetical protein